jgi:predicted DNA-binding protein
MQIVHHRPELAKELCNRFERSVLDDAGSGMFLAAPRRTGKSTFLREDLLPEMQSRGWVTVYVDLWADMSRNPAQLITEAIRAATAEYDGAVAKWLKGTAQKIGLQRAGTSGINVDFEQIGQPSASTLAEALEYLANKSGKPVALVIDEAQQALIAEEGMNAMFALKAARDRLNQGQSRRLFLVFTGSHRDKLSQLVLNKSQPFFGASVTAFPLLDQGFTEHYARLINKNLSADNQFDPAALYEAFVLVGHRPELLMTIVREVAVDLGEGARLDQLIKEKATEWRERAFEGQESNYAALTPVQQAVLRVMCEKGADYFPFSEESIRLYQRYAEDPSIATHTAQAALEALRTKGLVWRSARGVYALEDESWTEWLVGASPKKSETSGG